jgi:hypothetical protein
MQKKNPNSIHARSQKGWRDALAESRSGRELLAGWEVYIKNNMQIILITNY